jgi:hypothetical protein
LVFKALLQNIPGESEREREEKGTVADRITSGSVDSFTSFSSSSPPEQHYFNLA